MGVYDSTGANPVRNLTPAPKVKRSPVGTKRKSSKKASGKKGKK